MFSCNYFYCFFKFKKFSYFIEYVGIGVPLDLMTTGKGESDDPVEVLMYQRRKMLDGQTLKGVAPATLSSNA